MFLIVLPCFNHLEVGCAVENYRKSIREKCKTMSYFVAIRRVAAVLAVAGGTVAICPAEDVSPTHGIIQLAADAGKTGAFRVSNTTLSLNWSGYVLPNFTTQTTYTASQASWTVPAVTYQGSVAIQKLLGTNPPELSSTWVGIGGYCETSNCSARDTTLIQLGTSQEAATIATSVYYAWYEMLPAAPVPIPKVIAAGDSITASLSCASPCTPGTTQSWTLSMTDATRDWTWSTTVQYASPLLSSEWILEAPMSSTYGILPLPNYTGEAFNPVGANGLSPTLASADTITMIDPWGESSSPSAPVSGDEFNTCFGATVIPVACSAP
jgi:hypothetical protein